MANLVFKRICNGLYINHKWGMTISRDSVWPRGESPKWTAKWKVATFAVLQEERQEKFDSLAEARAHLQRLVNEVKARER